MLNADVHFSASFIRIGRTLSAGLIAAASGFLASFGFRRWHNGLRADGRYSLRLNLGQNVRNRLRRQSRLNIRRNRQGHYLDHSCLPGMISNDMFTIFRTILHTRNEGSVKQSMFKLSNSRNYPIFSKGLMVPEGAP